MPPQRGAPPTSRRALAALAALVAFTAVLVAVPLATSETAEAHTKTERRCTYNRQLSRPECQDVHVSHTHTDNTPEGRNGDSDGPRNGGNHTPPATTAPPPATAPRQCPAGTHRYGNGTTGGRGKEQGREALRNRGDHR